MMGWVFVLGGLGSVSDGEGGRKGVYGLCFFIVPRSNEMIHGKGEERKEDQGMSEGETD